MFCLRRVTILEEVPECVIASSCSQHHRLKSFSLRCATIIVGQMARSARHGLGQDLSGWHGSTYTPGRTVPAHVLHLWPRHPIRVGPCRAGPKARAAHRAFFEISLFPSLLFGLWHIYIAKISLFYVPTLWVVPYNTSICLPILCALSYIWSKVSLFHLLELHVVLGRPIVMRHRPKHSPTAGPCRHGPNSNRALPCLVRAIEPKPRALGQRWVN